MSHFWGSNVIGAQTVYDSAGRSNGVFDTGNQWLGNERGDYINFDDSATGLATSKLLLLGNASGSGGPRTSTFSAQGRVRIGTVATTQAIYSGGFAGLEFRVNGSGQTELLLDGVVNLGASTGTLSAGVDADIGVNYDGSTVSFYIDGAPSGSTSASPSFDHAQQHQFGARSSGSETISNGSRIYHFAVWSRPRSAGEFGAFCQLTARNVGLLFQAQRRLWAPGDSATPSPVGTLGQFDRGLRLDGWW